MAQMENIRSGRTTGPPRLFVYGSEGVGKTTFGAATPNPIFVLTEDGLGSLEVDRFPIAGSVAEVVQALEQLRARDHQYETIVIDTVSWLERLIHDQVCTDFGPVKYHSIEKVDGGFQRGYVHALTHWRRFIEALDRLRNERGMACLLVAHARVEKYEAPGETPVDRYSPRVHKLASALLCEWADAVLFATWKYSPSATRQDQNARILRTESGPHCIAKNRYGLPPEMLLSWPSLMAGLFAEQDKGE
jgi:hypothetical protein